MENDDILAIAVHRAIRSGWHVHLPHPITGVANRGRGVITISSGDLTNEYSLFDHHFAKALWGDCTMWVKSAHGTIAGIPVNGWQRHLQNMVIADDPIEYLKEHI